MAYHSEREGHVLPRVSEELSDVVRDGIGTLIRQRVTNGSFGLSFPELCPDSERHATIGTDEDSFRDLMRALIPSLESWPWVSNFGRGSSQDSPSDLAIFDAIEFCWTHVAQPIELHHHHYYGHPHLSFDQPSGREDFRRDVEEIFRRNGVAYEFTEAGRIERLLPPEFGMAVSRSIFRTGDAELNRLLTTARTKFLNPNLEKRREALEALWDAWERIKTIRPGADKKSQAKALLDATAGSNAPKFREALENEAKELTCIGNGLRIRHSETNQERLVNSEHVDYVFQRMFSLLWMFLRTLQMAGVSNEDP